MLKICLPAFEDYGHKFTVTDILEFAKAGKIGPNTVLENASGKKLEAGSIQGIKFKPAEPTPTPKKEIAPEAASYPALVELSRNTILGYFAVGSFLVFLQVGMLGFGFKDPILIGFFLAVGLFAAIWSYKFFALCTNLAMESLLMIDDIRRELKKNNRSKSE